MLHEIQGVAFTERQYLELRKAEELAAEDFKDQYKQQMFAEWVREPTVADLRRILKTKEKILKSFEQSVEGIISAKPFSPARFIDVMKTYCTEAKVATGMICPICGTPKANLMNGMVFGRRDNGMRCAFNRYHDVADMSVEVMSQNELNAVFGRTWLSHITERGKTNAIAKAVILEKQLFVNL
ncbi:MAG: hypothetical protein NT121_21010 [Chloroflexi bacterium]|nr:hypothetical protein [Chloroflexota bacterium]